MASVQSVKGALETAVVALVGSTRATLSDLRTDLHRIGTADTRVHQLEAQHEAASTPRSDLTYPVGNFLVRIAHRLADPTDEAAYTDSTMLTHQASLLDPSWWEGLSGVYEITEGPQLQENVARVGQVVSYAVSCGVAVSP